MTSQPRVWKVRATRPPSHHNRCRHFRQTHMDHAHLPSIATASNVCVCWLATFLGAPSGIFGHGVQNPQTLARPQPVEVNHSSSQGVATRNIESDLMAAQGQPVTERHLTTVPPIHEVVDGGIHCHLQRGYVCKGTNHHAQELEQVFGVLVLTTCSNRL